MKKTLCSLLLGSSLILQAKPVRMKPAKNTQQKFALKDASQALFILKTEAENYTSMSGIQIEDCSEGGLNIGWTDTGDWMNYAVNVPDSGTYTIEYRVASSTNTGSIQFKKDLDVLSTTVVPNTGGWQNWTTVTSTVKLVAGIQTITIYADGPSFNINWFSLKKGVAPTPAGVYVDGKKIMLNGNPFFMKGVCWNPIGVGGWHPDGLNYGGYVEQDAALMKAAGINVIRTYAAITDRSILDKLYAHGIYVINTVYSWGGSDPNSVINLVNAVKTHPAILMWCIGNEWNYNGIYVDMPHDASINKLNHAAAAIRTADTTHPITTVYGHIPSKETINAMPNIDVWGLNVYSGLDFGNIFNEWPARSSKPMYFAEYGADAWNSNINQEDSNSQGYATKILTKLIIDNSVVADGSKACSGGTIFEWADEWWKSGDSWSHNSGGQAPGGGPYPDFKFNEEYWGVVDIYRNPRPAYFELQTLFTK